MSSRSFSDFITHIHTFSLILLIVAGAACISGATAERTATTLTTSSLPGDPAPEHGFHIRGELVAATGEPLENKRVILESSQVHENGPGQYAVIGTVETRRGGAYDFYRPRHSPPEYLRVSFAGNSLYEPSMSAVLPLRGVGTPSAARIPGTGDLIVSTDPVGAEIYLDSAFSGTTPRVLQGIAEGPHLLEVGLGGYQNETMEVYISSERISSFSITLSPAGFGAARTGFFSETTGTWNITAPDGDPVFSFTRPGVSMQMYARDTGENRSATTPPRVTTVVSNDTVNNGYNVMVIMTDR